MQNTGTFYRSTEKIPQVILEFRDLLPPLSQEQREALEKDILQNGCYAPLIVDQELRIVDGHNRYTICKEHEIPYTMLVFEFESPLEAKQWALDTQKGRRNLDNWELGKIALKLKPEIEARAQANRIANGGDKVSENARAAMTTLSGPLAPVNTRKELANSIGIGEVTMGKVMKIDEQAPDTVKAALDNRELSINQGYNLTRQLQQVSEDQREDAAQDALKKLRKAVQAKDAEIDRRTKIAKRFCTVYEKVNLLEVNEDYIRIWVDCTRMKPDEIADAAEESYRHGAMFYKIGDICDTTGDTNQLDKPSAYYVRFQDGRRTTFLHGALRKGALFQARVGASDRHVVLRAFDDFRQEAGSRICFARCARKHSRYLCA